MRKTNQEKVIAKTRTPLTQEDLEDGMKKIGIEEGDVILVHSSLSAFGFIIGGEVALFRALQNTVGKMGTILVPSQSSENSDPMNWENPPVPEEWWEKIRKNMPAYDKEEYNCRGMGRLSNYVLQQKGRIRSEHPIASFAGIGAKAKRICKIHNLQPMFGKQSPLGSLYEIGAKVLLLGVGYHNSTCFHLSEVLSNKVKTVKEGTKIKRFGKEEWITFIDFDYNNDDFDSLGFAMEEEGFVRKEKIGLAECKCYDFKKAVDFGIKWILKNRS